MLFCLEDDALAAFLDMLLHMYSHSGPEEMFSHQGKHSIKAQVAVANLIMASCQGSLPACGWQYQLEQCLLGPSWQDFSVKDVLPQLEVVAFPKKLSDLVWVSCLIWPLAHSPIFIFTITWSRMGSASWACCLSLVVIQVTRRPSSAGSITCSHSCMLQWDLWGPWGKPPVWLILLQQWFDVRCLRHQVHTSAKTPSTRCLHQCWLSLPYNSIGGCNWQGCPPSDDSQHPALL